MIRDFLGELLRSIGALAAYCGAIGLAAWAALVVLGDVLPARQPSATVAAPWSETNPAHPLLRLDLADFIEGEPRQLVRRHGDGGRRDMMVWGEPGNRAPAFAIELYRRGPEAAPDAGPLEAFAARFGKLSAPAESVPLPTKFGTFSMTRGLEPGPVGRLCVGFLRHIEEPSLQIAGIYCDRVTQAKAVAVVACALDRLSLSSAGGDARLAGLFARAQLEQSSCTADRLPVASVPKQGAWIDTSGAPRLRDTRGDTQQAARP